MFDTQGGIGLENVKQSGGGGASIPLSKRKSEAF